MTADMTNNFQRKGAISNSHAGREFESAAHLFFKETGIALEPNFSIEVGYAKQRHHKFDLGSEEPPILVECKSYTWTETGKSPSAKIRGMNEVMLHFSVAPEKYRKILFVLKDVHTRRGITLAKHYIQTQGHLVGPNIEIWEFDLSQRTAERLL